MASSGNRTDKRGESNRQAGDWGLGAHQQNECAIRRHVVARTHPLISKQILCRTRQHVHKEQRFVTAVTDVPTPAMTETQEPVGESLPSATGDQAVQAVDVQVLVQYLRTVVPALLEEDDVLHPSFKLCLQDSAPLEKLKKFITDPQTKAVLIQRASVKGNELLFNFR